MRIDNMRPGELYKTTLQLSDWKRKSPTLPKGSIVLFLEEKEMNSSEDGSKFLYHLVLWKDQLYKFFFWISPPCWPFPPSSYDTPNSWYEEIQ